MVETVLKNKWLMKKGSDKEKINGSTVEIICCEEHRKSLSKEWITWEKYYGITDCLFCEMEAGEME